MAAAESVFSLGDKGIFRQVQRFHIDTDFGNDSDGSENTILANDGVLEREINVDGKVMKKYWILL